MKLINLELKNDEQLEFSNADDDILIVWKVENPASWDSAPYKVEFNGKLIATYKSFKGFANKVAQLVQQYDLEKEEIF